MNATQGSSPNRSPNRTRLAQRLAGRLADRMAQRLAGRSDGGYALVITMCFLILLSGVSYGVLKSADISQNTTQKSRSFIDSRNGMDTAAAEVVSQLNKGAITYSTQNGSGSYGVSGTVGSGTYSWSLDASAHTLTVSGVNQGVQQSTTYPVRARYVSSVDSTQGPLNYGIPAGGTALGPGTAPGYEGAWAAALATGADSTFDGDFTGEWDIYAGTVKTSANLAPAAGQPAYAVPSLIGYSDDAKATTLSDVAVATQRGQMNGHLDKNQLLNERRNITTGCTTYLAATFTLSSGNYYCPTPSISIGNNGSMSQGTSTTTLIVNGDLRINGDISAGGGGQLHIYVTGNVIFGRNLSEVASNSNNVRRTLTGVYLFAPSGTCQNSNTYVWLTGSIACRSVNLTASGVFRNKVTWKAPAVTASRTNITDPALVYYLEAPGFFDSRS